MDCKEKTAREKSCSLFSPRSPTTLRVSDVNKEKSTPAPEPGTGTTTATEEARRQITSGWRDVPCQNCRAETETVRQGCGEQHAEKCGAYLSKMLVDAYPHAQRGRSERLP